MSITLTGTQNVTLTTGSDVKIAGIVAYEDVKGGKATEHSSIVSESSAGTAVIVPQPERGVTRTVTAIYMQNAQHAGSCEVTITAAGSEAFSGTLAVGDELTFDGSSFHHSEGGGDGGNEGGGSQPFLDLGTVTAAELVANGPKTLYTPAAGEAVILFFVSGVTLDHGSISFGPMSDQLGSSGIYWTDDGTSGSSSQDALFNAGKDVIPGAATYFPSGPIVARWGVSYSNDGAVLLGPVSARQSSHAYTVGQGIVTADSLGASAVFICSVAGTSAGSAPDFSSAGPGDTVTDGGVTWLDNGQRPTVGSVHVVALAGVPVAP